MGAFLPSLVATRAGLTSRPSSLPLFTEVPRRYFLGSLYPGSCIAPSLCLSNHSALACVNSFDLERERDHKEVALSRVKRMVAIAATSALLVGAVSSPVLAVNDAFVPGENCSPDFSQAVGHPAFIKEQSPVAGAPFSANNPGVSEGANAGDLEPSC